MNLKATNPATRGREKEGRRVFLYLDHGYRGITAKIFGRGIALSLRSFNADGRRAFRKETIRIKFRFDNRYFALHKLGRVLVWNRLCAYILRSQQQHAGNDHLQRHCVNQFFSSLSFLEDQPQSYHS